MEFGVRYFVLLNFRDIFYYRNKCLGVVFEKIFLKLFYFYFFVIRFYLKRDLFFILIIKIIFL